MNSLETQIMKKYPTLELKYRDDNIVYDYYNKKTYLIVSQII